MDFNRVSEERIDFLIRQDEWLLYTEEEKEKVTHLLQGTSWLNHLTHQLNSSIEGTPERILQRLNNRTRIHQDIDALFEFSNRDVNNQKHFEIQKWAKRSYRIKTTRNNNNNTNKRKCTFTGETPEILMGIQFSVLNMEKEEIETSEEYFCCETYDTVVKAWNLLAKFEAFVHRIVQQKMEAKTPESLQKASIDEKQLQYGVNEAARFITLFFLDQRTKRNICNCTIIKYHL